MGSVCQPHLLESQQILDGHDIHCLLAAVIVEPMATTIVKVEARRTHIHQHLHQPRLIYQLSQRFLHLCLSTRAGTTQTLSTR